MAATERPVSKVSDIKTGICGTDRCNTEYNNVKRMLTTPDDADDGVTDRKLELSYINMYKCLKAQYTDPDIIAIQLDSLLAFGDILSESSKYSLTKLEELMDKHMIMYCTGLYTHIYQTFVVTVLGQNNEDARVKQKYTDALSTFVDLFNIANVDDLDSKRKIFDVLLLKQYLHKFYIYAQGNHSMTDLLTNGTVWTDVELNKRPVKRGKKDREHMSKIFEKEYEIGCNCFCGTITFGVFLRLLSKNKRIHMGQEDILFYIDYAQQGHIAVGININKKMQLYLETTCTAEPDLDLLDISGSNLRKIMSYLEATLQSSRKYIEKVTKGSVINPIQTDDIPLIILANRFTRRPCASVWYYYIPEIFENPLFDLDIANNYDMIPAIRLGKLYNFMRKYNNSEIMWTQTMSILRRMSIQLQSISPGLKAQRYNKHTYQEYFKLITELEVSDAKAHRAFVEAMALRPHFE